MARRYRDARIVDEWRRMATADRHRDTATPSRRVSARVVDARGDDAPSASTRARCATSGRRVRD
jgi:hypothetical protein